jgi:hypothetical protein
VSIKTPVGQYRDFRHEIFDGEHEFVCTCLNEQIAKEITTALNSLPSLVEALKEARELIEPIATNWSDDARVQAAKAIEVINEALKGTPQ